MGFFILKNLTTYFYLRIGLILVFTISLFSSEGKSITLYQMLDSSEACYDNGKFIKGINWANKALKIAEEKKDENGIMYAYLALGKNHFYEQNYALAINSYFSAIKIAEKRKEKQIESDCYNYVATIYYAQNDFKKATEYFNKSIKADPGKGMTRSKANNYGYLAGIYYNLQKYDSSLILYQKAIQVYINESDSVNLVMMKQNIAGVYSRQGKIADAQKILEECLAITLRTKDSGEIGYSYFSLGIFFAQNNLNKKAIDPLKKALACFRAINDDVYVSNTILALSDSYYTLKMYKESLDYFKDYKLFQDSTHNIEIAKELTRKEINFTVEKKELADSLKRAVVDRENKVINDEKFKRQSIYIYAGVGGFLLMLILAIVLLRSNRHKQKTNEVISKQKQLAEEQKEIIEMKQKEIIDSIKYAKRIQDAILPNEKRIQRIINSRK